jgi:hypothetical protein
MDMAVAASLRNVRDDSLRLQAAQASRCLRRIVGRFNEAIKACVREN